MEGKEGSVGIGNDTPAADGVGEPKKKKVKKKKVGFKRFQRLRCLKSLVISDFGRFCHENSKTLKFFPP